MQCDVLRRHAIGFMLRDQRNRAPRHRLRHKQMDVTLHIDPTFLRSAAEQRAAWDFLELVALTIDDPQHCVRFAVDGNFRADRVRHLVQLGQVARQVAQIVTATALSDALVRRACNDVIDLVQLFIVDKDVVRHMRKRRRLCHVRSTHQ